jgi:uncharacterized protein YcfJ
MDKRIFAAVFMAHAGVGHAGTDLIDTAKVISATPVLERITESRQECAPAAAAAPAPAQERSILGPVVGGVAGAVIGHQVGSGRGNTAATAAGAIAGTIIGDKVGNRQATAPAPPAQQCRTVQTTREVVKGYTVVYRYNGRDITTTLPNDPGPTVRVGVGVVDGPPTTGAPTAGMLGSNVREVSRPAPASGAEPAPAFDAAPAPSSNPGGFQYRY